MRRDKKTNPTSLRSLIYSVFGRRPDKAAFDELMDEQTEETIKAVEEKLMAEHDWLAGEDAQRQLEETKKWFRKISGEVAPDYEPAERAALLRWLSEDPNHDYLLSRFMPDKRASLTPYDDDLTAWLKGDPENREQDLRRYLERTAHGEVPDKPWESSDAS